MRCTYSHARFETQVIHTPAPGSVWMLLSCISLYPSAWLLILFTTAFGPQLLSFLVQFVWPVGSYSVIGWQPASFYFNGLL